MSSVAELRLSVRRDALKWRGRKHKALYAFLAIALVGLYFAGINYSTYLHHHINVVSGFGLNHWSAGSFILFGLGAALAVGRCLYCRSKQKENDGAFANAGSVDVLEDHKKVMKYQALKHFAIFALITLAVVGGYFAGIDFSTYLNHHANIVNGFGLHHWNAGPFVLMGLGETVFGSVFGCYRSKQNELENKAPPRRRASGGVPALGSAFAGYGLMGIPNYGNTCYFAACMQMIMSTRGIKGTLVKAKEDFSRLVSDYSRGDLDECKVTFFLNSLGLTVGEQHDATELLARLAPCPKVGTRESFTRKKILTYAIKDVGYLSDETYEEEELIKEDLTDENLAIGLQRLFSNHLDGSTYENTDGRRSYDACGGALATVTKEEFKYSKAPKELILSVKRFKYISPEITEKIETLVPVPSVLTVASDRIDGASADKTLHLKSFIVHSGGVGIGHYISVVKKGEKWFVFDDSSVYEISKEAALKRAETAYMFYYADMDDGGVSAAAEIKQHLFCKFDQYSSFF
jgi:hypothetical protein